MLKSKKISAFYKPFARLRPPSNSGSFSVGFTLATQNKSISAGRDMLYRIRHVSTDI
jgi:hypothetical protein